MEGNMKNIIKKLAFIVIAISIIAILTTISFAQTNLALNKPATASTEAAFGGPVLEAGFAVDGDLTTLWASAAADPGSWWQVDLEQAYVIGKIVYHARSDVDQIPMRKFFEIQVSNDPTFATFTKVGSVGEFEFPIGEAQQFNFNNSTPFRYVRVQRSPEGFQHFTIAEVEVYEGTGSGGNGGGTTPPVTAPGDPGILSLALISAVSAATIIFKKK